MLFVLLASVVPLCAQTTLTVTPSHCVYQEGDTASWQKTDWTEPSFDDSSWQVSAPNFDPYPPTSPYVQTRCWLDLRKLAATGPVFVQVETFSAWNLFVDGHAIASFGDVSNGSYTMNLVQRYQIPDTLAARGEVLVALREMRRAPPPYRYSATVPPISVGAEKTLADGTLHAEVAAFKLRRLQFFCYAFIGVAGVFLLILSNVDRGQRDLFWLGIMSLGTLELRTNELAQLFLIHYPQPLLLFLTWIGQWLFFPYLIFFFSLNGRRIPRAYFFFGAFIPVSLVLPCFSWLLSPRVDLLVWWYFFASPTVRMLQGISGVACAIAPIIAFWPPWRIPRRNLPLFAVAMLWASGEVVNMAMRLPWFSWIDPTAFVRDYRAVCEVPAIVGMFFLLARRQRKVMEERAALQNEQVEQRLERQTIDLELQQARELQQHVLIPEPVVSPFFLVETAYHPDRTVGGDFFQVVAHPDGSLLVVVGDVSGKGVAAAMLVAVLVGAIRTRADETFDPAAILHTLNERLVGRAGGHFATCIVAHILPGGAAQIANAGHLSPYLNGRELSLAGDLPLGMIAQQSYETTTFSLLPGQQLTFMTDGVVEAQCASGELFGFTRTEEISMQSAQAIAQNARQFGQSDDITAVTVAMVGSAVAAAY